MARNLAYTQQGQVTKADMESIRDIAHSWHDPSADQFFSRWTEQPVLDGSTHRTDDQDEDGNEIGDPLYNIHISAELKNVPDENFAQKVQNLKDAINNNFPEDWPEATDGDISVTAA